MVINTSITIHSVRAALLVIWSPRFSSRQPYIFLSLFFFFFKQYSRTVQKDLFVFFKQQSVIIIITATTWWGYWHWTTWKHLQSRLQTSTMNSVTNQQVGDLFLYFCWSFFKVTTTTVSLGRRANWWTSAKVIQNYKNVFTFEAEAWAKNQQKYQLAIDREVVSSNSDRMTWGRSELSTVDHSPPML